MGPISETGRNMEASLRGAIAKGMPVDQAITYVKSMAQQGVAPLVDLFALLKQFERMRQPPAQFPQGGTIRDQLNRLEASQQISAARGLPAAMPSRNPEAMMGQGLGALNAGNMESPGFAGGGIVAFDQGGTAQTNVPKLYSDIPKFGTFEEAQTANIARLGQDPTKFVETEEERLKEEQRKRGLGEFAPSMTLREKLLAEDRSAADRLASEEAQLDTDEYWGDVASNAAERGATLLTSLAKAQKGKATRKRATAEKVKKATRDIKLSEIALQEIKELKKEGRYKEAAELEKKIYGKIEDASEKIATAAQAETQAVSASKRAKELALINKSESDRLLRDLRSTPETLANGQPNPEHQKLFKLYLASKGTGRGTPKDFKVINAQWTKAKGDLKTAQENYNLDDSPENAAALQDAQEMYNYWNSQFLESGDVVGMPSEFGGSAQLPPGFVPDK